MDERMKEAENFLFSLRLCEEYFLKVLDCFEPTRIFKSTPIQKVLKSLLLEVYVHLRCLDTFRCRELANVFDAPLQAYMPENPQCTHIKQQPQHLEADDDVRKCLKLKEEKKNQSRLHANVHENPPPNSCCAILQM